VIRKITLEWEEWFDKFRRLYARLAKRVSDDHGSETGSQGSDPHSAPPASGSAALPSLDQAKANWRARRGLG
jgi:hypothetical protein